MRKRTLSRAVILSAIVVLATVAPFTVAPVSAGDVTHLEEVPAENVGPPDHAEGHTDAGPPTHAEVWNVHASEHAEHLTVEVDELEGDLALRLGDEHNHDGREVAVEASTLEEVVGETPETAYGIHSSGDRWSSEVRYSDGLAVFEVPRFSENTVTFDAELSIEADPAEHGDTFSYNLTENDTVDDFTLSVTGVDATEDRQVSGVFGDGYTETFDVGGNTPPADATVTLEGVDSGEGADQVTTAEIENTPQTATIDTELELAYYLDFGDLYATDYTENSLEWSVAAESDSSEGFALGDGYLASVDDDTIDVYETATGDTVSTWSLDNPGRDVTYNPVEGRFWVVSEGGHRYSIDPDSIHDPAEEEDRILVTDVDALIESSETGEIITAFDGGESVHGADWTYSGYHDIDALDVDDGKVYLSGDGDGTVTILDVDDGSTLETVEPVNSNTIDVIDAESGEIHTASDTTVSVTSEADGSHLWGHDGHDGQGEVGALTADGDRSISVGLESSASDRLQVWVGDLFTTDPEASLDGETVASHVGELEAGESVEENVTLEAGESVDLGISTAEESDVDVSLEWTDVTETRDVEVSINSDTIDGETVTVDGTIADGDTESLDVDPSWLREGENTVEVRTAEGTESPVGLVGLNYSHTAEEEREVEYSASAWSEEYRLSKVWESDVDDATLTIPWGSERVVDVRNLTVTVGGDELTAEELETSTENGTLEVGVGSVLAGETVTVDVVGSKVVVENGAVEVLNSTPPGESLDSTIEVVESSDGFALDVDGTAEGHLIHYTAAESWSGASSEAVVDVEGAQTLEADAPEGGTFDVRTIPVELEPDEGAVRATVSEPDADEPVFFVGHHNGSDDPDTVDIAYHGSESGEEWDLIDLTNHTTVDTSTASSPVWFTATVDGVSYTVDRVASAPSSGTGVAAVSSSRSTGLDGTPTLLLLGLTVSILGILGAARRFGVESRRGYLAIAGATGAVTVVAVEAVTHGSVLALTLEAIVSPFDTPGAGTVVGGLVVLGVLSAIHARIGLPAWLLVLSVVGVSVWVLDTIAEGALTSGLSEVSPLIWLSLVGLAFVSVYLSLRPRPIEIGE